MTIKKLLRCICAAVIIVIAATGTVSGAPAGLYAVPSDRRETAEEKTIYSYVQVPENYSRDNRWTGSWVTEEYAGQEFMSFGCGICCLTNIYDTLAVYDESDTVTPDEMMVIAEENTGYHPINGRGAISWEHMQRLCEHFGLSATVCRKSSAYEDFKDDVSSSDATTVLVCKDDDDKLWFYTNGHYVTLWLYDDRTGTVFVSDSSGLFNRQRVKLEDVYKALKSRSDAQYMCVKKNTVSEQQKEDDLL